MAAFRWFVLLTLAYTVAQGSGQAEKDPHRPPCTSAECRKIRTFVKAHYCGASPFANGPDDGCDTRVPKKISSGVKVVADFECRRDEVSGKANCQQHGEPSAELRRLLLGEVRRLGLPHEVEGELHFMVWQSSANTLAAAYYEHVSGDDLTLCQLIAVIDQDGGVQILRKVRFQKTDADVPEVTRWAPIDIADVDGDGRLEVILQGDDYENHWYEVHGVRDGSFKMIFSGLGYYL